MNHIVTLLYHKQKTMKALTLTLILFLTNQLFAQTVQTQFIKSEIKKVKLFLTSGEMYHDQTVKLQKGRNKLIFTGISAFADPKSIQFTGEGAFKLVSVSTEMDFLAAEGFNPRIKLLQDSLEELKDRYQFNQDNLASLQMELDLLNANKKIGGANQNLTSVQIKEAADFYRTRSLEINTKLSKFRKEQNKLNILIDNTRFQLVELNYNENQRSNQVVVLLDVSESISLKTHLKYLVSDCGWAANYDLSANDLNQKINLKYMAQVYNNTGNHWNEVELILSTADPRLSASFPELNPWYLSYSEVSKMGSKKSYYAPQVTQSDYRQIAQSNIDRANERAFDNYILEKNEVMSQDKNLQFFTTSKGVVMNNKQQVNMKQIQISELMAEFPIQDKFSCPSDARPYKVDIKEMNLEASFTHITVPKLDNAAFLMAHIVGWQELELMPGPTNVYFGGAYVGVSEIDTRTISDTLSLSFGRDNKVLVMRKLKKEMSTKKIIGNNKRESFLYEIAIRNNRNTPINIDVFDQIPISRNSEISVTVDQLSGSTQHPETGEVKWKVQAQPNEVKNIEIGYSVKYPKDAKISLVSFRTVSCPSF